MRQFVRTHVTGQESGWLGNPTKFRQLNGWLTVLWAIMLPLSIFMGWINLVAFISAISIYANFGAHLSTWAASRTEERMEQDETEQTLQEIKQTQHEQVQTETNGEHVERVEKKVDKLHEKLD